MACPNHVPILGAAELHLWAPKRCVKTHGSRFPSPTVPDIIVAAVADASKGSVLSMLTKGPVEDLGWEFGFSVSATATKNAQMMVLADSPLGSPSVPGAPAPG
jgi:hypothetical protein